MSFSLPGTPQTQLLVAVVLFLAGLLVGGYRPDRWKLALALLLPASALTIWLVFGPEITALVAPLLQHSAPAGGAP